MTRSSASSARGTPAGRRGQPTVRARRIDFSDIPEATAKQLRAMRRVGRQPIGATPRKLIAIRLDPLVLQQLRRKARRRRIGYQTLINEILAGYAERLA
jgi:uncharacterized protein (DUF4415 family)